MDPIQDQPPLMSQNDVQRVGEIGARDAICVLWMGFRMRENLARGHLEPHAVTAPPG